MNIDEIAASLDSKNQADAQEQKEAQTLQQILDSQERIKVTIESAVKSLINFQSSHEPNVSLKNQKLPTSIKTPDVQGVIDALNSLKSTTESAKPDNTELLKSLEGLQKAITELPSKIVIPEAPEPLETVTVKNQPDYKPDFDKLAKTVKSIDVKPNVTVNQEKVSLDLKPIIKALDSVVSAVSSIPAPPKVDLSKVVQASQTTTQAIQALRFPIPNFIQDPLIRYKIADVDDDGVDSTPNYYGYVSPEGNWYIQKEDKSANPATYRYANGNGNGPVQSQYPAQWTARAAQNYNYFNLIFP